MPLPRFTRVCHNWRTLVYFWRAESPIVALSPGQCPGDSMPRTIHLAFLRMQKCHALKRVTLKRDTALLTYHLTVHFHQDIFYFLRGIFSFLPHIFHHLREKVCYKVCNIYYKVANMYYKVCNACYKLCNKNFLIG